MNLKPVQLFPVFLKIKNLNFPLVQSEYILKADLWGKKIEDKYWPKAPLWPPRGWFGERYGIKSERRKRRWRWGGKYGQEDKVWWELLVKKGIMSE